MPGTFRPRSFLMGQSRLETFLGGRLTVLMCGYHPAEVVERVLDEGQEGCLGVAMSPCCDFWLREFKGMLELYPLSQKVWGVLC
jgi:hypothetical protein